MYIYYEKIIIVQLFEKTIFSSFQNNLKNDLIVLFEFVLYIIFLFELKKIPGYTSQLKKYGWTFHFWAKIMTSILQGERTKLVRFVDPNVQGAHAEDIRIYESIVIEFFLRLKIHKIGTYVPRFHIEECNFIFSMPMIYIINHETLATPCRILCQF